MRGGVPDGFDSISLLAEKNVEEKKEDKGDCVKQTRYDFWMDGLLLLGIIAFGYFAVVLVWQVGNKFQPTAQQIRGGELK